ncbi:MAG: ABC transporter permease [Planctomycetes bacterium]|nr:ABC transporter permease [Planctomycetota bacterium]
MRNAWLVAAREYGENVRTKGFWIGILIFPILITIGIKAESWLERAKSTRNFVVVDQSGKFDSAIETALARLQEKAIAREFQSYMSRNAATPQAPTAEQLDQMKAGEPAKSDFEQMTEAEAKSLIALSLLSGGLKPNAPPFEVPRTPFRRVPAPDGVDTSAAPGAIADALRPFLRGDRKITVEGEDAELFATLIIPKDVDERVERPGDKRKKRADRDGAQYWSANLADSDLREELERAINEEQRRVEYVAKGLDGKTVEAVQQTKVPLARFDPKKAAGAEEVSIADQIRQWAPVGFVYLLWISIFSISQMLLNNTIEEKSNRLIEVLLSSVTSWELMVGKLVGIAAVGMTMLGAWLGFLVAILAINSGPEAKVATSLLEVLKTSGLLPAFAVYFLLGYLLYGALFLALGSVCNTLKEAQNMMQPVVLIMIVPLMTMMFIPKDPNGTVATVLSWIPIYTPFVMMNRAAASPPMFEIVGTTILLAITVVITLWFAGRIFRIGVLRTGQPPKLMELVRWLRH